MAVMDDPQKKKGEMSRARAGRERGEDEGGSSAGGAVAPPSPPSSSSSPLITHVASTPEP